MSQSEHVRDAESADETLVAPRFDNAEAVTARPVVPLDAVPDEEQGGTADFTPPPGPERQGARRPSWPLALVLLSALVGVVLGGTGLYLYQRSRTPATPAATAQGEPQAQQHEESASVEAPAISDEAGQVADHELTDTEPSAGDQVAPQSSEAAVEESARVSVEADAPAPATPRIVSDTRTARRETTGDAARVRTATDDAGRAGPLKRGKRGQYEAASGGERPRRVEEDEAGAREDEDDARRGRRRNRRGQTEPREAETTLRDQLRAIFEGRPR